LLYIDDVLSSAEFDEFEQPGYGGAGAGQYQDGGMYGGMASAGRGMGSQPSRGPPGQQAYSYRGANPGVTLLTHWIVLKSLK